MARAKKKKEELAEENVLPVEEMAADELTSEDFIAAADAEAEAEIDGEEVVSEEVTSAETVAEETVDVPEDLALTQEDVRLVEAILFASSSAVTISMIAERFPKERVSLIPDVLEYLKEQYANRGVNLVQRENRWALRTATDLGDQLRLEKEQPKKFTKAAMETMAIVAYHQPVTRAEIENIRGVATSPGALDALMEAGWIKPGKRREVPGRPVTWLSTQAFLDHFGLEKLEDLPGMEELKAAGLLDKRPAVEAMPTADMFDGEAKAEHDPQEVTDEDLIGQANEPGASAEDLDVEMGAVAVAAGVVMASAAAGDDDDEEDEDGDLDDEDDDLDDEDADDEDDDSDDDEDEESDDDEESDEEDDEESDDDADEDEDEDESDDDEDDEDSDDEDEDDEDFDDDEDDEDFDDDEDDEDGDEEDEE